MDDDADDDYGLSDAATLAALDAAERSHAQQSQQSPLSRASVSATAAPASRPTPPGNKTPLQARETVQQPVPQKVARTTGSAIIVSPRQKGNPILNHIKNVPWEYGSAQIVPDYVLGEATCALFLSLKYHKLHPDYIYTRIRTLGNAFKLRVLLILVDITEHSEPLRELSRTSLISSLTIFLAWSAPEAGRYLETFKAFEHTPPTNIQEKVANDYPTRLVEVLTQVRSVNKTDAVSLVSTFGSVRAAINARSEEISMIGGWGPQKVGRFEKAVTEPFRARKAGGTTTITAAQRRAQQRQKKDAPRGTDPKVAARLGIGAGLPSDTAIGNRNIPATSASNTSQGVQEVWDLEDDEEAIAAVLEAEAEMESAAAARRAEKEGAFQARPAGEPDMQAGVAEALARLRERAANG